MNNIKLIKLRSVFLKDEQYYKQIDNVTQAYLARKDINKNTLKRFGKLWVRNLIKNILLLADAPGISNLKGLFTGIPCLVIASGPSANLILDILLKYLKDFF